MNELLDQIVNYLRGIWHFRWYAMTLTWVLVLAGWVVVAKLPDVHEASARVYVDTDSMLRPLLSGIAIRPNISQQLELMTRTLLSRPNIEKLTRMTDLDLKASTPEKMESMISDLQKDIHLKMSRRQNLYTISYQNRNPDVAKKVVESLLNIFVESTLGKSRQDTSLAQQFLVQKIQEYEERLRNADNRIKNFKIANVGLMPSSGRGYFKRLQSAQAALAQARLELREITNRRDELRRQITGEEPVYGFGNARSAVIQQGSGGVVGGRIGQMKIQLDELLLRYTDRHPEVIALKNTIKRLEQERKDQLAKIPKKVSPVFDVAPVLEQNPVYQQLKISLGESEAKIASLRVRVKEYRKRVAKLKKFVDTIPRIEAELKNMNRDYDITKKNYNALVARLESAKLSQAAEKTGEDVKFKIIDPPRVPLEPSGPNRLLLSTLSLIAGIGGGLLFAFLLSQIRPVIYGRRGLELATGLPVFGTVSILMTRQLRRKKRLDLGVFTCTGIGLFVAFAGVLLFQLHIVSLQDTVRALQSLRALL